MDSLPGQDHETNRPFYARSNTATVQVRHSKTIARTWYFKRKATTNWNTLPYDRQRQPSANNTARGHHEANINMLLCESCEIVCFATENV